MALKFNPLTGQFDFFESTVRSITVDLTKAQMRTMADTPVALLAAPGAGLIISPVRVIWSFLYGGTPYDQPEVPQGIRIKYSNGGSPLVTAPATLIQLEQDQYQVSFPGDITPSINEAIEIIYLDGNPASTNDDSDGNSTMRVTLFYTIDSVAT